MIAHAEAGPAAGARRLDAALRAYVPVPVLAGAARAGCAAPWTETLSGALLIADLAGFTRLADRVAERGRLGAEQLVAILNRYYARILEPVFRRGGQAFRFGGDSLVAFFPGDEAAAAAAACALDIHAALAQAAPLPASAGGGRLRVSAGIAAGSIELVSAAGGSGACVYLLLGGAVAAAVRAQDAAAAGETLVAPSVAAALALAGAAREDGFTQLEPAQGLLPALDHGRAVRVDTSFARGFIHPALAERLRDGESGRYGEHRRVAALFVQIDGLHAAGGSGESAAALAAEIAAQIARAVGNEGGIVLGADPTPEGAKFLAAFGLDRAGEHDALRAALAALAIARELRRMPGDLEWRLGLNAGTVLAADLGVRRRRDYTVLGDPINVAARLAAGAPAGQAVAHASLEEELRPAVRLRRLPAVAAKGKSVPLARVQLLEQRRAPLPAVVPPLERIEGRDVEIAHLLLVAQAALSGPHSAAALLTGAAGTGKSALIGVIARAWEERGGQALPLALGRFDASLEPYGGWTPLLRALLGLRRGEPARPLIAAAVQRWQIADPAAEALLARVARTTEPSSTLNELEPKLLRERLLRVVCAAVRAAARERPLAVIADGLERLDSASRDLFLALLAEPAEAPLMLLASSRRETVEGEWSARIALEGIDDRALELVVCVALGAAQLDRRVTAFLQSRTSGNPLFAIALAREALSSGAITVLPGTRSCVPVADLATLPAPESLAGLLLSAIDGLDELDRRLVQAAAICGQRFPLALLAAAEPAMPRATRERAIDRLIGLDILVRGDDEIVWFRRPLQREAAYASLASRRRRRMHRRIADALWNDSGERERRDLAAHLMAAGDARLAPFALSAGEEAAGLADGDAALRALRTITEGSARVRGAAPNITLRALLAEGDALVHLVSRYTPALRSYARALRLAQRLHAEGEQSEGAIAFRIGYARRRLGQHDSALRWLRRAARAEAAAPPRIHAEALLEAASTDSLRGRTANALRLCAEALTVARAAGDETEVARCLDNRGTVLSGMGRLLEAIGDQQESVAISTRLGTLGAQAKALTNLGAAYFRLARWDEAAAAYRQARDLRARLGDTDRTAQAGVNLGEVLAMRGEFAEALRLFAECRAVWERSGYAIGVAHARLFAGQALLRESRAAEAVEELSASYAAFVGLRLNGLTIHAGDSLVEALASCGRGAEAAQIAARVEEIGQTVESAMYAAFALRAAAAAANDDRAILLLKRAAAAFEQLGMAWERAATLERLAHRLAAIDSARAGALAEEARGLFAELRATPDALRTAALARRLAEQLPAR